MTATTTATETITAAINITMLPAAVTPITSPPRERLLPLSTEGSSLEFVVGLRVEVVVTGELDGVGVWEDVMGGPLSQGEQI